MKKFLSIVLVSCLFLSVFSISIFAVEPVTTQPPKYTDEDNSFWNKIFGPIKNSFDNFKNTLVDLKNSFVNNIIDLKNSFVNKLIELKDNFYARIGDIGSWLDFWFAKLEFWINGIKQSFYDRIGDIKIWFSDVGNSINSTLDRFNNFILDKLDYLFVPKFSFSAKISEWKNLMDNKFAFFTQIQVLLNRLLNFSETATAPKFEFTFMGFTGGLIDFSAYAPFRSFVQSLILFFAWFSFIRRIIKGLPQIIMSAADINEQHTEYLDEKEYNWYDDHGYIKH